MAVGRGFQTHVRVDALCIERARADARPRLRPRHHRPRRPPSPPLLAGRPRPRIHDARTSPQHVTLFLSCSAALHYLRLLWFQKLLKSVWLPHNQPSQPDARIHYRCDANAHNFAYPCIMLRLFIPLAPQAAICAAAAMGCKPQPHLAKGASATLQSCTILSRCAECGFWQRPADTRVCFASLKEAAS